MKNSTPSTVEQLTALISLSDDWDSYGAMAPSLEAIHTATKVISRIITDDMVVPAVVPGADGSIQLEWHVNGIDLEVEVLSDNSVYVYCVDYQHLIMPIIKEGMYLDDPLLELCLDRVKK